MCCNYTFFRLFRDKSIKNVKNSEKVDMKRIRRQLHSVECSKSMEVTRLPIAQDIEFLKSGECELEPRRIT